MVLRFEVDQAAAFRQGVNVEKSTNHIEVNPSTLSQEERSLIADRLEGIDVVWLCALSQKGKVGHPDEKYQGKARRIVAKLPTFEALMKAIKLNQSELSQSWPQFTIKLVGDTPLISNKFPLKRLMQDGGCRGIPLKDPNAR
jgi:hypothetical protein